MATAAPTFTDPAGAVSHLEKISPEMRGCAILDSEGRVLAASENPEGWAEASAELLAAADAAGGEPVEHVHLGTGESPQWLYTVVFDGRDLWGESSDPTVKVSIEAFEPYLEPT